MYDNSLVYRSATTTYVMFITVRGERICGIDDDGKLSFPETLPEGVYVSIPGNDNYGLTPTHVRKTIEAIATISTVMR